MDSMKQCAAVSMNLSLIIDPVHLPSLIHLLLTDLYMESSTVLDFRRVESYLEFVVESRFMDWPPTKAEVFWK